MPYVCDNVEPWRVPCAPGPERKGSGYQVLRRISWVLEQVLGDRAPPAGPAPETQLHLSLVCFLPSPAPLGSPLSVRTPPERRLFAVTSGQSSPRKKEVCVTVAAKPG